MILFNKILLNKKKKIVYTTESITISTQFWGGYGCGG
jgi:hypothetical protein